MQLAAQRRARSTRGAPGGRVVMCRPVRSEAKDSIEIRDWPIRYREKIFAGRGRMARPDSGQAGICRLAKVLSFGAACGSVPTASVANASMCAQAADGDSYVHRFLHSCHYFRPRALIVYVEPTV
jgi:hypothetical protein